MEPSRQSHGILRAAELSAAPLAFALLVATTAAGAFTIDEANHLVMVAGLREGELTVPGTGGLPPSPELLWFDPAARFRGPHPATPVASTAPPLYPFFALPFALLGGWRGLFALSSLCFVATAVLLFLHVRAWSSSRVTPWLAAAAFALAGFGIEYAQGAWPQTLSVLLGTGAFVLAARAWERDEPRLALGAGLLAGAAAGVRYQNVVLAAAVGAALFVASRRRGSAGVHYALGVAVPLALCSWINHERLGSWNPLSKGPRYLRLSAGHSGAHPVVEALHVLWAKVVDFSSHPPFASEVDAAYMHRDPVTDAYVVGGVLKKAWMQSSPWVALALVAMLLAGARRERTAGARSATAALGCVLVLLALFAASGFGRYDGFGYNQRYFLELVPLAAIGLAWALDGVLLRPGALLASALLAAAAAFAATRLGPWSPARHAALLLVPLLLGLALAAAWLLSRRRPAPALLSALVGASLGWGAASHLGDDWRGARRIRAFHALRCEALAPLLPERAGLFAWWGNKDAFAPLLLEKDLVLADPWVDGGADAPRLVAAMLADRRSVFVVTNGFPARVLDAVVDGRATVARRVPVAPGLAPLEVLEVRPAGSDL